MNYELSYNAVVLQVLYCSVPPPMTKECKGLQSPPSLLTTSPLLAVTSKQSCTDLQKEKEEVCTSSEEALKTLKERHKEELVQLEDRCALHPHP